MKEMIINSSKEFEPSNDLALISLIGFVKKAGFEYRTSDHNFASGAKVSKPYSYDKDYEDVFTVTYYVGRSSYGRRPDGEAADADRKEVEKLSAIAQMLMDRGLGVDARADSNGNLSALKVFAYDVTADLDAYIAALRAQEREDAKVSPEVKAIRIDEARKNLAERLIAAQDDLAINAATVRMMFENIEKALASGDAAAAESQAEALAKMGGTFSDFSKLASAMYKVKSAQAWLASCEALELKDAQ